MAYLALGRLRPVFDLRQQRRLDPDATVRDFLRIGLGLPDQRLEPRLQILRRCGVKAVVDLTCVDQLLTPSAGRDKGRPTCCRRARTLRWKASRWAQLFFYPIIDATRNVSAVADL